MRLVNFQLVMLVDQVIKEIQSKFNLYNDITLNFLKYKKCLNIKHFFNQSIANFSSVFVLLFFFENYPLQC